MKSPKNVVNQIRQNPVVKRISAAVIVDGLYSIDNNGNRVYRPRDEKEMERLASVVRSAVGYEGTRGDTVEVVNLQFVDLEEMLREDGPCCSWASPRPRS